MIVTAPTPRLTPADEQRIRRDLERETVYSPWAVADIRLLLAELDALRTTSSPQTYPQPITRLVN